MKNMYTCPGCNKDFAWDDKSADEYVKCPHCGDEMLAPKASLSKGDTVGDYVIIERIGVGGMGEVYLATQKSMQRKIALKILHEDLARDKSYLDRFFREVRTLAAIEHPNIVRAIEAGADRDIYYLAMSYVDGIDIKRLLDDGRIIPEGEALKIVKSIGQALKHVWEKHRILHRDVKPANIMITPDGESRLMDLGISKKVTESVDLTMPGMMVGSPLYVSPEQAKSDKDIDFRADMYSLGASFYHMITGLPPYNGDSAMAILASHLADPVPDPRKIRPEISEQSALIIFKMMAKKKEDRFASWDELIALIDEILEQHEATKIIEVPAGGKTDAQAPCGSRRRRRAPVLINSPARGIIVALAFIILLGMLVIVSRTGSETKRKKEASATFKKALQIIDDNPEPLKLYKEKIALLEKAYKLGEPPMKAKVKEKIQELNSGALAAIKTRKKQLIESYFDETKAKAGEFLRKKDYDKAVEIWNSLKGTQPCSDSREMKARIDQEIEYLKSLKKKNAEGID